MSHHNQIIIACYFAIAIALALNLVLIAGLSIHGERVMARLQREAQERLDKLNSTGS